MTRVRTVDITKRYEGAVAVDHVNLEAEDRKFVTLLGPSGCGKSTTLKIIAGLIYPDEGSVYFDENQVTELPPDRRNIGFVFQRIALFPHMNVAKNIAFGLKMRHKSAEEIRKITKEVLSIVHMEGFKERTASQLSGGQAQRIEIARVLATDPDILLFDEPLSNIDAKLRDELKYEIRRIQKETGKTMVYVTHDQAEAFAISDKIYVMNNGRIDQVGAPVDLYLSPNTPFVAGFIGSSNFLEGKIVSRDKEAGTSRVEVSGLQFAGPYVDFEGDVLMCVRPEDIRVVGEGEHFKNVLEGTIRETIFAGMTTRLNVEVDRVPLKVDLHGPDRFNYLQAQGKPIRLGLDRCTIVKRS